MPIRVLLVEDNRPDARLVESALRDEGLDFTLQEIEDAESAAAYIDGVQSGAATCPDVLILDLNLPRGDGLDLLDNFRKCPRCAATPVIVMTSSEAPGDVKRAAAAANTRYFRKPLDLDAFMQIGGLVREVLNKA